MLTWSHVPRHLGERDLRDGLVVPVVGGCEGEHGLHGYPGGPVAVALVGGLLHNPAAAHRVADGADVTHVQVALEADVARLSGGRVGEVAAQGSLPARSQLLPQSELGVEQRCPRVVDGRRLAGRRRVDPVGADGHDHEPELRELPLEVLVAGVAGHRWHAGGTGPRPHPRGRLLDDLLLPRCFHVVAGLLGRRQGGLGRGVGVGRRAVGAGLPGAVFDHDRGMGAGGDVGGVVHDAVELVLAFVAEVRRRREGLVAQVVGHRLDPAGVRRVPGRHRCAGSRHDRRDGEHRRLHDQPHGRGR
ncbi:hypothetical protein [Amycolatopsis sp. DSM 110486]|uniref:hypothetical protein n=1 Tax=Amycolatopsis sp. DSM 110486 TaxID=2865832 RepID=UPI001C6A805A|nr:hypothetical protein [Amycolatopsis sp. DSM 110486]QYN19320.1 hypothetical protein K1T34_42970 [Amycolatopsis sp. DSM 110486]